MYYHHVYHIHAHITCLRSSIVMYMVWFQIAVEWPQQGSSWLCAADGFGSHGYEAHWAGCDSGSKTVLARIGFFFLNWLKNLFLFALASKSGFGSYMHEVAVLLNFQHWIIDQFAWGTQTEMLPCLLVGRTSSTSSCMRCDARYQLTQWSGRWAMC